MPRDPRTYLFEIVQAAERVQRFVGNLDFAGYEADELVRAGVERQFEIMGEALNQLMKQDAGLAASIREHRKIVGFRNLLIHGYAEVDNAVVWSILTEKLPLLLEDTRKLLIKLGSA